jgi:ankyrin repeat protein
MEEDDIEREEMEENDMEGDRDSEDQGSSNVDNNEAASDDEMEGDVMESEYMKENDIEDDSDSEDQGSSNDEDVSDLKWPDYETVSADRRSRELQAFHIAATKAHARNFKFLLERGLPTSHQDQDGNTVLHHMATDRYKMAIANLKILLNSSKPNLDIHNKNGLTPLALAIQYRNKKGLKLLLDAGANMEITVLEDQTALHIACQLGNLPAVEALLQHGCQTSRLNGRGQTPKDVALAWGHHEIAAAIQNSIDSTMTPAETHPETLSSKEQLPNTTPPDLTETQDHPGIPVRRKRMYKRI